MLHRARKADSRLFYHQALVLERQSAFTQIFRFNILYQNSDRSNPHKKHPSLSNRKKTPLSSNRKTVFPFITIANNPV